MAKNQALQQDDTFEVVYALYQEAKAFSPDAEPHAQTAIIAPTAPIIQSRKPRNKPAQPSLFTRISDLKDEAVATKLSTQTAETSLSDEETALEDDFAIPDSFGPDSLVTDKLSSDEALDDEALSLLTNADNETLETMSDDVRISDEIEPSVSLDDVLDGLSAPEAPPSEAPPSGEALSEEAKALAALDATRPEADDALINQLADVKSAVEQAQEGVTHEASNDASDEGTGEADIKTEADDWQDVSPSPALATFIAETVRDVLNEELPHRVRGLVDEALGERQGRYGRSETPHIGLRTKPSRH